MAGWKNWAALETVTEPDFQGYLQDQVVMRFANAAARDAALGSNVAEGMLCWLQDVDWMQIYRGGTWRPLGSMRQGFGYSNAPQNLTSSTWAKLNLGTFNAPANQPGRAVWTSDGKVRVPFSGSYLINGQVSFPSNNTGQRVLELQTSTDGTTWTRSGIIGAHMEIAGLNLYTAVLAITGSVYLAANRYLALFAMQDSGATLTVAAGTAGMSVLLLGAD